MKSYEIIVIHRYINMWEIRHYLEIREWLIKLRLEKHPFWNDKSKCINTWERQNIETTTHIPVFALLGFQVKRPICCLSRFPAWAFAMLVSQAAELLIYVITRAYVNSLNWGNWRNPPVTFQTGKLVCTIYLESFLKEGGRQWQRRLEQFRGLAPFLLSKNGPLEGLVEILGEGDIS